MGKQWKQCQTFFFWAPKSLQMVTAAMKLRRLLLGRKVMTNLDSIFKSRDITLPTKVSLIKAMVFPVVMYGCESWTVKKAEPRRIDAFELWCWRRLLRVPWTARRSNQSILKEISPGISLEGMMLMLKLQYFGHLMRRVDLLEKALMLGGIGGKRRTGRQRMRWLDGIIGERGGRPALHRFRADLPDGAPRRDVERRRAERDAPGHLLGNGADHGARRGQHLLRRLGR